MKSFKLKQVELNTLIAVVENAGGKEGVNRKDLRKIDRVCDVLDISDSIKDEEDKEKEYDFQLEDSDWDYMYKCFLNFSNWVGQRAQRKSTLALEDKLAIIDKEKSK